MSDGLDFEHWSHLGQERAIALDRTNAADPEALERHRTRADRSGRGEFVGRVVIDISFSLDGFIIGRDPGIDRQLRRLAPV